MPDLTSLRCHRTHISLLGDNRNGSSDARVWEHTYVSKDDILAKAIFRYYPFNRFGAVK